MSDQGMTALYQRLESDEAFRTRIQQAGSPQDKRRLVSAEGYDVDESDLSTLRSLAGTELSDADLEKVAGGTGAGTDFGIGVGVTVVGAGAAAAAAVAL